MCFISEEKNSSLFFQLVTNVWRPLSVIKRGKINLNLVTCPVGNTNAVVFLPVAGSSSNVLSYDGLKMMSVGKELKMGNLFLIWGSKKFP